MCIFKHVHCSVLIYVQVLQAAPSGRVPVRMQNGRLKFQRATKGGKVFLRCRLLWHGAPRKLNSNCPPSEESDGSVNCMQLWGLIAGLLRGGRMMSPPRGAFCMWIFMCRTWHLNVHRVPHGALKVM